MTMGGAVLQLTCENHFFTQCRNAETNNKDNHDEDDEDDEDDKDDDDYDDDGDDGECNIDDTGGNDA